VSYISHQKAWVLLASMRPGASKVFRGVGVERSADGTAWSINGAPWGLLLRSIDRFVAAAGFQAYQEVWPTGMGKWSG
jgi:hypothetical protein